MRVVYLRLISGSGLLLLLHLPTIHETTYEIRILVAQSHTIIFSVTASVRGTRTRVTLPNHPQTLKSPAHYNTKQPHTIHDQKQHKQSNLYSISMFMDIIYYLRYAIRCLTWCGHKMLKKDFAIWCIMRNWFFMYLIFFYYYCHYLFMLRSIFVVYFGTYAMR